ncbi:MAG: NADH-quinone oxidoreductase subunit N [Acidobacteriota bacterium]|nr:NADH-quinone oxidoreductase subunit N [Acidobacteriota bacterium]
MKLWAILPELVVATLCLALVPISAFTRNRFPSLTGWVAIVGIAACIPLTGRMLAFPPTSAFAGTYALDGLAAVFKLLILSGSLLSLLLFQAYFGRSPLAADAAVALLFATLGALGVASSSDLGLIVLFFQMMSISGYVLAALVRGRDSALEAALKYLIYGGAALAVMAFGLTFLYGLTGSLDLAAIGRGLAHGDRVWIGVALSFVLAGYGFETTMVPFHSWAPDVYEGSTAPAAGFLSVVPKAAGFAALLRFLIEALPDEMVSWPVVIAVLAAATMTLGNLAALRQKNLKRLLAYSSIAQAGYVLMAVAQASRVPEAVGSAAYYLAAYLFMNLGAFAVAARLERSLETDSLESVRGLGTRDPASALVLTLSLLSLAGIPPLAGFAGKVLLLEASIAGRMTWLAVVAAANMIVALFYYVSIVAAMFLGKSEAGASKPGWQYAPPFAVSLTGTLVLGLFPGPALGLMQMGARIFMGGRS